MEQCGLKIIQQGPVLFPTCRQQPKEPIETNQHQSAGEPAAEKFSQDELCAGQRFGQEGK